MAIDGVSIALITTGSLLVYSGFKNVPLKTELQSFLRGQVPAGNPTGPVTVGVGQASTVPTNQTTPGDTQVGAASGGTPVPGTDTSIQNYGLARLVAGTYGWAGGQQWSALTQVIARESGGNPNAQNASGAYGIAQALGHGDASTQGTVSDSYGGYGVPTATCIAANSGSASAQLVWMMAYIKETYGTPAKAWANEESAGYY